MFVAEWDGLQPWKVFLPLRRSFAPIRSVPRTGDKTKYPSSLLDKYSIGTGAFSSIPVQPPAWAYVFSLSSATTQNPPVCNLSDPGAWRCQRAFWLKYRRQCALRPHTRYEVRLFEFCPFFLVKLGGAPWDVSAFYNLHSLRIYTRTYIHIFSSGKLSLLRVQLSIFYPEDLYEQKGDFLVTLFFPFSGRGQGSQVGSETGNVE